MSPSQHRPPFSDKLMTTLTTSLIGLGIGFYGTSAATSLRSDLTTDYARLMAEIAKYSAEGGQSSHRKWLDGRTPASCKPREIDETKIIEAE